MKDIISIICTVCFVLLIFSVISLISTIKKKIYNDMRNNNMTIKMGSIYECDQMIDEFITHEFNNYCMYNLNHLNIDVVSDSMQNKIRNDLIEIVKNRISDNILNKMLLFYNTDTISDIIVEKIYILVTSWVINIDESKSNKELEIEASNRRKNKRGMV